MLTLLFILSIIGWYRLPDGDTLKSLCKFYFNAYIGLLIATVLIAIYILSK